MSLFALESELNSYHPKPTASWVSVTPEIASRWLQRNGANRPVRPQVVRQYALDMQTGNWELTGESIKFSVDGTLLDGQHRLSAIAKSGCTVTMMVVRGVPDTAQTAMDTGRKRTASDMLNMRNYRNATLLAATARLAVCREDRLELKKAVTHAQVLDFVQANPDVEQSVAFIGAINKLIDVDGSVAAYSHWEMTHLNHQEADIFWKDVAERANLPHGDPALVLSNRLAEIRRARIALPREGYLSMIFRAWNARRAGKTITLLKVSRDHSSIVIPTLK